MSRGLDIKQLRGLVIRPALKHIGLHSAAAENLVLGTALVESNGVYLKQLGAGPALGLFQMEPDTIHDIWTNYLFYNADLARRTRDLMTRKCDDDVDECVGNLYYAAALCRLHYRRVRAPLPLPEDAEAMAHYWKDHYNTHLGAGRVEKAVPLFAVACREV